MRGGAAALSRQGGVGSGPYFFEGDELEQIAQAAVLQKARIAACQEQLDELASAAGALDKRMEACEAELQRFLGREE